MAYYDDPAYMQRIQALRKSVPVTAASAGPFAATRNAVASRLQGQSMRGVQNTLGMAGAGARQQAAQFGNQQAWAKWQGDLGRAQQALVAREQINAQRKLDYERAKAARKKSKMGLISSGLGALGAVGGTILAGGNPMGGYLGAQLGSSLGGSLNG